MRTSWATILLIVAGCESRDEQLANFAERSIETQRQQNAIIGRQSEQVVLESRALAEAAKEVVAADAQSRHEMIAAQRELNQGLQAERAGVHRQRDELERERREIAEQRFRDPVIAATLHTLGVLMICIAPLALAGYALCQLHRRVDDACELGDLLVEELATDLPLLLPSVERPRLIAKSAASLPEATSEGEPPF